MKKQLHVFEGIGIELEYMIVDSRSTVVRPIADTLFEDICGKGACEYLQGEIGWSNELARHVVEIKNIHPRMNIAAHADLYQEQIVEINSRLASYGCRLMPTGMHPFMDPASESLLWPVDEENIYRTYDRIFNCRGHGWMNLQSIHCNISFTGDDEFARLHTAIRLVLPLLPALCASTPYVEGKYTGVHDNRLEFYRNNQKKVPLVTGRIIPEAIYSRDEYEQVILQPMYRQIAPFDPDHIVRYEWLNSRGAIARFDRMAIEIRLMDVQECPAADCALCALVIAVVQALVEERLCSYRLQCGFTVNDLDKIFCAAIQAGGATIIDSKKYLSVFGMHEPATALSLWESLAAVLLSEDHFAWNILQTIVTHGTLAQRMLNSTGRTPDRQQLINLNKKLCGCLSENGLYV